MLRSILNVTLVITQPGPRAHLASRDDGAASGHLPIAHDGLARGEGPPATRTMATLAMVTCITLPGLSGGSYSRATTLGYVTWLSPYQVYQRQLLKGDYSCGAVDGASDAHRYYTSDELAQACSLVPAYCLLLTVE